MSHKNSDDQPVAALTDSTASNGTNLSDTRARSKRSSRWEEVLKTKILADNETMNGNSFVWERQCKVTDGSCGGNSKCTQQFVTYHGDSGKRIRVKNGCDCVTVSSGPVASSVGALSNPSAGCVEVRKTRYLAHNETIDGYRYSKKFVLEIYCKDMDAVCGENGKHEFKCKQLFAFYDGHEVRDGQKKRITIPVKVGCACG